MANEPVRELSLAHASPSHTCPADTQRLAAPASACQCGRSSVYSAVLHERQRADHYRGEHDHAVPDHYGRSAAQLGVHRGTCGYERAQQQHARHGLARRRFGYLHIRFVVGAIAAAHHRARAVRRSLLDRSAEEGRRGHRRQRLQGHAAGTPRRSCDRHGQAGRSGGRGVHHGHGLAGRHRVDCRRIGVHRLCRRDVVDRRGWCWQLHGREYSDWYRR